MKKTTLGTLLFGALKSLLFAACKLFFIALAWACKLGGLALTNMGTVIENIILRRS